MRLARKGEGPSRRGPSAAGMALAFAFAPCGAVQPAFPLGKPGRADGPVFQGVTDDGRRGPGSLFSAGGSLPLSVSKTVFSLKQRTPDFPCGSCFVMGEKFIFSSSDGTGRILWCARFLLGEWGARALGGFPRSRCRGVDSWVRGGGTKPDREGCSDTSAVFLLRPRRGDHGRWAGRGHRSPVIVLSGLLGPPTLVRGRLGNFGQVRLQSGCRRGDLEAAVRLCLCGELGSGPQARGRAAQRLHERPRRGRWPRAPGHARHARHARRQCGRPALEQPLSCLGGTCLSRAAAFWQSG